MPVVLDVDQQSAAAAVLLAFPGDSRFNEAPLRELNGIAEQVN